MVNLLVPISQEFPMSFTPSRRRSRRRCAAAVATTALALVASAGTAPAALAAKPHHHAPKATPYAFRAVSYGTRVHGGELPASSGTTSYQAIACTNRLGTGKDNQVASVQLPGLGTLDGVYATTGTTGSGDNVSTYATHEIASLGIEVPDLLGLKVKAISASSVASHDASGYHATTDVHVARIVLTLAGQDAVDLPLPKPNAPVVVPGLLSISIGKEKRVATPAGAIAKADGLVIQILPTNTRIQVAHTATKLNTGVKRGLFFGKADATQVRALGGLVRSGPQPLQVLPCQGTGGTVRSKSLASVSVPGVLEVTAAGTNVMGDQSKKKASGFTQASVAHADVLNGTLVLDAIKARAHVSRTKQRVKRDIEGTTIGAVTVNGQPMSLAALDGFEIPGVPRVDTNVVTKKKSGIEVVGVRITLLDGSGAVIDLAHAALDIAGSGLTD
jgi:hypothetical protein